MFEFSIIEYKFICKYMSEYPIFNDEFIKKIKGDGIHLKKLLI